MLLPSVLSWMVVSYILYALFATENGVFNHLLISLGMDRHLWYSSPAEWPAILTIMKLWKGAGMSSIIYLAAITGIDSEQYDAAMVDGAGRMQLMIHITLPQLLPMVCILTIMGIGGIFRGDFGMIYSIIRDNGVLYPTTDVIDTYIYRGLMYLNNVSMSTAAGLYQSAVGLILVLIVNAAIKKIDPENGMF
jgi:putative aldouronate transport system permease protein